MKIVVCGIAVADVIATGLKKVAEPGEVSFASIQVCTGGHACNVSIDLIQLGMDGRDVSTLISLGNDPFGEFLRVSLERKGIKPKVYQSNLPTSKNLILVVSGEDRRFHADVGANLALGWKWVMECIKEESPEILYIGGSGWLGELDENLEKVCREARKEGCIIFVDVLAPYTGRWDFLFPALKWVDVFHCNNLEAESMTGATGMNAARKICGKGVKACLITKGEEGLIAALPEHELKLPAFPVKVVDPTGAGDAFCAGILYKLREIPEDKERWRNILSFGSACGAACCTGVGTTSSVYPEIVQRILK